MIFAKFDFLLLRMFYMFFMFTYERTNYEHSEGRRGVSVVEQALDATTYSTLCDPPVGQYTLQA